MHNMRDFKKDRGKRSDNRGGFGRKNSWQGGFGGDRDRDRGPADMHEATCVDCGRPCSVPFRPIPGKAVYCDACFSAKKETGEDRFPGHKTFVKDFGRDEGSGDNGLKKQLEILNGKVDKLIAAVESLAAVFRKK
jgi:CxxC-x17-CxxC domain-containing protein